MGVYNSLMCARVCVYMYIQTHTEERSQLTVSERKLSLSPQIRATGGVTKFKL